MQLRTLSKWAITILVLMALTGLAQSQTYTISGAVSDPNTAPVEGVRVMLYTQAGDPIGQYTDTTDASGLYSISDVITGTYGIAFRPPSDSLAPVMYRDVVIPSDITFNVQLEQGYEISGIVTDELDNGIPDIDLNIYDQLTGDKLFTPSDNTNEFGEYDVVVRAGIFRIRYRYRGDNEDARYVPIELQNITIASDTTIDVTLVSGFYIDGTVTGPGDDPVIDADLDAEDSLTGEKLFTPNDNTDENGEYRLLVPAGTYNINVAPLPENHLIPGIVYGIPVFNDVTLDFILEAGFMLYGTVRDPEGTGVFNVDLDITYSDNEEDIFTPGDNTDEFGIYQIILPQYGTYDVLFKPPVVSPYLAPIELQGIYLPEDTSIDVTLPYGVLLSGVVRNSSEAGVLNVDIDAIDISDQSDVPLVGDYTDSSGSFATVIVPGTYNLEIEPPKLRRLEAQMLSDFTINENTFINVTLDTGMVVSGIVSDSAGAPISEVDAIAFEISTQQEIYTPGSRTDSLGFYQILISPDIYDLTFAPDSSSNIDDTVTFYNVSVSHDTTINVTLGGQIPSECYEYFAGDANMINGIWPPVVIGSDVTYLINYFRGVSIPCLIYGFFASADANGDCNIIGSDVTRLVNYFRGVGEIVHCPDYNPCWLTPDDLPDEAPAGWPNCETLRITGKVLSTSPEE